MPNLLCVSQLSVEGGLSNVLLFTNIGLVGIKASLLSFLFADSDRSIFRPAGTNTFRRIIVMRAFFILLFPEVKSQHSNGS